MEPKTWRAALNTYLRAGGFAPAAPEDDNAPLHREETALADALRGARTDAQRRMSAAAVRSYYARGVPAGDDTAPRPPRTLADAQRAADAGTQSAADALARQYQQLRMNDDSGLGKRFSEPEQDALARRYAPATPSPTAASAGTQNAAELDPNYAAYRGEMQRLRAIAGSELGKRFSQPEQDALATPDAGDVRARRDLLAAETAEGADTEMFRMMDRRNGIMQAHEESLAPVPTDRTTGEPMTAEYVAHRLPPAPVPTDRTTGEPMTARYVARRLPPAMTRPGGPNGPADRDQVVQFHDQQMNDAKDAYDRALQHWGAVNKDNEDELDRLNVTESRDPTAAALSAVARRQRELLSAHVTAAVTNPTAYAAARAAGQVDPTTDALIQSAQRQHDDVRAAVAAKRMRDAYPSDPDVAAHGIMLPGGVETGLAARANNATAMMAAPLVQVDAHRIMRANPAALSPAHLRDRESALAAGMEMARAAAAVGPPPTGKDQQ